MRILVLGAGGFIGRHVLAELLACGHEPVGVVRRAAGLAEAFPGVRFLEFDLATARDPADWAEALDGVEAVVNVAGVLRGPDMEAVHVGAPAALYRACVAAGVRRVVLVSAISARPEVATDYARTKLRGEAVLRESGPDWTILRPSLVYAEGSYGGTSLLRALAALPWRIPLPGDGRFAFSPIHAEDLARCVRQACEEARFGGATLEPAGPETLSLRDLLTRYRAWLGFGPARFLRVPLPAMRLLARLGDRFGRGPVSSNSLDQLIAGNGGDGAAFAAAAGFAPRSLETALRRQPAQVQDRWHARLFFVAPALRASLLLLWLASGLLGLLFGSATTRELLAALSLPGALTWPLTLAASLLDFLVAAVLLLDRGGRWATRLQLAVVLGFTLVLGTALPGLWLDPLGPLLKNLPILAAILANGALTNGSLAGRR